MKKSCIHVALVWRFLQRYHSRIKSIDFMCNIYSSLTNIYFILVLTTTTRSVCLHQQVEQQTTHQTRHNRFSLIPCTH